MGENVVKVKVESFEEEGAIFNTIYHTEWKEKFLSLPEDGVLLILT